MKSLWRKSSRRGGQGNCVEARLNGTPEIRDSKMGDASPVLELSRYDFVALLNNVKLADRCPGGPPSQRPTAGKHGRLLALWRGLAVWDCQICCRATVLASLDSLAVLVTLGGDSNEDTWQVA